MPDYVKKVQRLCRAELRPLELVEAAVLAQPPGAMAKQAALGTVGGLVGAAIGQRLQSHSPVRVAPNAGGIAGSIPKRPLVLAVTAERLLGFEHGALSGNPKALLVEIPTKRIVGIAHEGRRPSALLMLRFDDNSMVAFEAHRGSKPDRFAAALQRIRPGIGAGA